MNSQSESSVNSEMMSLDQYGGRIRSYFRHAVRGQCHEPRLARCMVEAIPAPAPHGFNNIVPKDVVAVAVRDKALLHYKL